MSEVKERLDIILVNKGIFSSREKARENIISGKIFVDGKKIDKCGKKIDGDSNIEFKGEVLPYVSRGGLKLEKALQHFSIDMSGNTCLDIGASTGGFTDCMLKHGAKKVYAIDVGTDQLDETLRNDSRVISIEKTNIRNLSKDSLEELGDFASIDVSFISLEKVIPTVINLLNENANVVALIKPQFEAGIGKVSKKGVVKKPSIHKEVIYNIVNFVRTLGLKVKGITYSSIKGPNGNIEYLIYFTKDDNYYENFHENEIEYLVSKSHEVLNLEGI